MVENPSLPHNQLESESQPPYTAGLMYGGIEERSKGGVNGGLHPTSLNTFRVWAQQRGISDANPNTVYSEIHPELTAGQAFAHALGQRATFPGAPDANISEPGTFEGYTRHGDGSGITHSRPYVHRRATPDPLPDMYNIEMSNHFAPPDLATLLQRHETQSDNRTIGVVSIVDGRAVRYIPEDELIQFATNHGIFAHSSSPANPSSREQEIGRTLQAMTENIKSTTTEIIVAPAHLLHGSTWELAFDDEMLTTSGSHRHFGPVDISTIPEHEEEVRKQLTDPKVEVGPLQSLPDISTFTRSGEDEITFSHNTTFITHNLHYKRHAEAFWARRPSLAAMMREIRPDEAQRDFYDQGVIDIVVGNLLQRGKSTIIIEASRDEIVYRRPWVADIIKAFENQTWRLPGTIYPATANTNLVLRTHEGEIIEKHTLSQSAANAEQAA